MPKFLAYLGFLVFISLTCSPAEKHYPQEEIKKDKNEILSIMQDQETAWSEGDLDRFMQGYWRSDSLQFIGSKGLTYGWQQTLDNYKKSYPDKEAMGTLSFDILDVESIDENHCHIIGKWKLERANDTPNGHFTLLWKKIDGEWKIIKDHSS